MRHGDDRALVLLQVMLQPLHRFGVKVVRRLVEQQHVRFLSRRRERATRVSRRRRAPSSFLSGGGHRSASIAMSNC